MQSCGQTHLNLKIHQLTIWEVIIKNWLFKPLSISTGKSMRPRLRTIIASLFLCKMWLSVINITVTPLENMIWRPTSLVIWPMINFNISTPQPTHQISRVRLSQEKLQVMIGAGKKIVETKTLNQEDQWVHHLIILTIKMVILSQVVEVMIKIE